MKMSARCLNLCLMWVSAQAWIPASQVGLGFIPRGRLQMSAASATKVQPPAAAAHCKTAVVGGGPTGLATALMLSRRGYRDIMVLERLPEPPEPSSDVWVNGERSYNLGIGGRGQIALAELDAADGVLSWCASAVGRKDWSPQAPEGAERIFTERKYTTKVIARDRLSSCLLKEVREKHADSVQVRFDTECVGVEWREEADGGGSPGARLTMRDTKSGEEFEAEVDLVVGADGVKSAIRESLEKSKRLMKRLSGKELRVKRFPDRNTFSYKVIPFRLDAGWRNDFNYSHRTKEEITLEMLPTKEGLQVGVLLFRPDNALVLGLKTVDDAKTLFKDLFPQFAGMIADGAYERLVTQPVSRLPVFSYSGPVLHLGRSAVLLGDAIKSVKPYFGLGVNTAFEDCIALDRCLEETGDDLATALPLYSRRRAPEAKDLVELSRGFDRTGLASLLGFVFPLVVDGVFHRLAPAVFRPNTISFLQTQGVTFGHIRRRKWLDRAMQAAIFAVLAAGGVKALRAAWSLALSPVVVKPALTATARLLGRG
ncbi:unnamed protein product [Discosporangium mesarthrocarpum]